MSTTTFLGLAAMLADNGLTALQLTKRPRVDVDWRDRTPGPFLAKRKAHGLLLSIDLPHANEVAQVTALAEPALETALARAHL